MPFDEKYRTHHTQLHAMLAMICLVMGGVGAYLIGAACQAKQQGNLIEIYAVSVGMVTLLAGVPLALLAEYHARRGRLLPKGWFIGVLCLLGLIAAGGKELSPLFYRPYLAEQGYVLCYTKGAGQARGTHDREYWDKADACPNGGDK